MNDKEDALKKDTVELRRKTALTRQHSRMMRVRFNKKTKQIFAAQKRSRSVVRKMMEYIQTKENEDIDDLPANVVSDDLSSILCDALPSSPSNRSVQVKTKKKEKRKVSPEKLLRQQKHLVPLQPTKGRKGHTIRSSKLNGLSSGQWKKRLNGMRSKIQGSDKKSVNEQARKIEENKSIHADMTNESSRSAAIREVFSRIDNIDQLVETLTVLERELARSIQAMQP